MKALFTSRRAGSLRIKLIALVLAVSLLPMMGLVLYVANQVYWLEARSSVSGLMNFVDAKQQGVIRFLGQNEKFAKELAVLVENAPPAAVQKTFAAVAAQDVFDASQHPFAAEVQSGQRKIPTLHVYHAIDFVRGGRIEASSNTARVGKAWTEQPDLSAGYSNVYRLDGQPVITFGAKALDGMVYVHADARMLSNIVSGEIGNLEGGSGAFYLAGVGKTLDYYIVDANNVMITDSRVMPDALLSKRGSEFPWKRTLTGSQDKGCSGGKYKTNAGISTGCQEAMGFYTGATGKQVLGASMPFYDSKWTIVVEQATSEILGPLYGLRTQMWLVTAGAAVAITAVTAAGITWMVSRPLTRLGEAANRIADGDVEQGVEVHGNDEVATVSRSFNRMIAYLQSMASTARAIADGDLTANVTPKSERDVLGVAFGTMIERLREAMSGVGDIAASLAAARDELRNSTEHSVHATAEVARTMQQVAAGTGEQALSVQQVNDGVAELNHAISQIAEGVRRQAESVQDANVLGANVASAAGQLAVRAGVSAQGASEAADKAGAGAAMVQRTIEAMGRIQRTVGHSSEEVARLGECSNEIGKIVAVIQDIAAQTNLLALNAAIEAARAGESGRGFAVVADEVRGLAERSASATKEIGQLIAAVQDGVERSVRAMDEGSAEVNSGAGAAAEAGDALRQILAATDVASNEIAQIASVATDLEALSTQMAAKMEDIRKVVEGNTAAANVMQRSADDVRSSIGTISVLAEQNSAATEQVSASAELMNAQAHDVSTAAQRLGDMANTLHVHVAAFRLERATADPRAPIPLEPRERLAS